MKFSYTLRTLLPLALILLLQITTNAVQLPDGFTLTQVATGMTSVTRMEFLPDGRILVLEQGGNIRVIENGVLRSTPFLTVDADSFGEHGLLGIALDPAFDTNHFFYIYYTAKTPFLHNRVSRFTINGDNADPSSEVVIFELDPLTGPLGWHQAGTLRFGADGKLYIAAGDDRNGANSQSLTNLFGKILRINSDGSIPTDNPFFASTTGNNRAIWALGLRNPYSFTFGSAGTQMLINDVGEDTWEEINRGVAGGNYGWPETEGPTSDPRFQSPIQVYAHGDTDDLGCAITGGVVYEPKTQQFPSSYRGKYFYSDFCNGWIRALDLNTLTPQIFVLFTKSPVDMKVANDGTLYYLERGIDANVEGAVFKIEYTHSEAPHITTQPTSVTVGTGQPASFTITASGAATLNYQWQRNGVDMPGENSPTLNIAATTAADNGATFACVVFNGLGSVTSDAATLTVVPGSPPSATITSPASGAQYRGGDVIHFSGTGSDPDDGFIPASAFTWRVDFHHNTHTHPFIPDFSGTTSGQFTIPTNGETATDVWYRIYLTVRDSTGLTTTTFTDIFPVIETITINTNPSGLKIKLDEQPQDTPETVSTVVGIDRTLSAVSPQQFNGQTYEFVSWSDGGAATHTVNHGGTFVANYQLAGSTPQGEVVLYASDGVRVGNYFVTSDATAAGGTRLDNPDAGAAKLTNALANPGTYVELQFTAQAGVPYRLWIRGKAQDDNPFNDSIFVQFADSVDEQGTAKSRIGSTSAEVINLEDCFACGLSGWGWQDNGWGVGVLGPLVYFANSGTHTLRIQPREDGLSLDQVVLSPQLYLDIAPGAVTNDSTILPKSDASPTPTPTPTPKPTPTPTPSPGADVVWVEDATPAGATLDTSNGDVWNWVGSNPTPFSGSLASQSNIANGEHQHFFYNSPTTLAIDTGDTLIAYVYLDPANVPSEVMLQWNDGNWEHRAYWGANNIDWGNDGTDSLRFMGPVPPAGQWVRLEVPASAVGLEGHVLNGMAFTLFGGHATWDHAGKTSAAVSPPSGPVEVVLYASEGVRVGNYLVTSDATAAGGTRLDNPDAGAAKLTNALANPGTYVELQFTAQAGVPYRLWIRGKAQDDNPFNDSIFVQFADSVDEQGTAKSRIGSTSAEVINLEDCFACGLSGWGWQDNGWGVGVLGPLVYFANSGTHTLRMQPREDGLSIDQIVLSPQLYLTTAPGAVINDTKILAKSGSP